ncbi:MAG: hypothetical protein J7M12_04055, partial [Candidatus Hydrogenedentes bacterium]|nr:hypothetical protein [Candidatus Hydrogenedentota bacterium]
MYHRAVSVSGKVLLVCAAVAAITLYRPGTVRAQTDTSGGVGNESVGSAVPSTGYATQDSQLAARHFKNGLELYIQERYR